VVLMLLINVCMYVCSPTKLCDAAQMAIFGDFFASSIFSEPSAAHFRHAFQIYTKATPCVDCGSMVDIQSPTAEIRRGKKEERKKIEITGQKYNVRTYYIGRP